MEPEVGIEPTTYGLRYRCSTIEPLWRKRVMGITPSCDGVPCRMTGQTHFEK